MKTTTMKKNKNKDTNYLVTNFGPTRTFPFMKGINLNKGQIIETTDRDFAEFMKTQHMVKVETKK